jgi:hypothetical protein
MKAKFPINRINLGVRRKTTVEIYNTDVVLGERDGEIKVIAKAKIKFPAMINSNDMFYFWKKRFPFVKRNGEFTVVGKAICGDNDTFDFEKGKRIAETHAQAKAYSVAERVYNIIYEELDTASKFAKYFASNCEESKNHAISHVKYLDKE